MALNYCLFKKIRERICCMTTDSNGNKGFVLTFQAREQHIRRERATSNITTNVALMALASTIYLALLGRQGLINVAKISYSRAHLLHNKLRSSGFKPLNKNPFYNELLMKAPEGSSEKVSSNLLKNGILGGLNLNEDKMLICCTELNTVQDIETFVSMTNEAIIK